MAAKTETEQAPSSKTIASRYVNRRSVERVQLAFDASKLSPTGQLSKELVRELQDALNKA